MAFNFTWPTFSTSFIEQAQTQLNAALNKGAKPANIASDINVKELNMGTIPPELEVLEIGELAEDKFRGIFKLTYTGDAHIILQMKIQANPVTPKTMGISILGNSRQDVLAAEPLVLPMQLQISNLRLKGIIVLVIDKNRGVTLVFKNDPLENVDVSSTFDGMPSVQRFLQAEIEKQLRGMFQEDLPAMVHSLSLRYLDEQKEERLPNGKKTESTGSSASSTPTLVEPPRSSPAAFGGEKSHVGDSYDTFGRDEHHHLHSGSRRESSPGRWTGGSHDDEKISKYSHLSDLHKGSGLKNLAREIAAEGALMESWENGSVVSNADSEKSNVSRSHVIHSVGLMNGRNHAGSASTPSLSEPSPRCSPGRNNNYLYRSDHLVPEEEAFRNYPRCSSWTSLHSQSQSTYYSHRQEPSSRLDHHEENPSSLYSSTTSLPHHPPHGPSAHGHFASKLSSSRGSSSTLTSPVRPSLTKNHTYSHPRSGNAHSHHHHRSTLAPTSAPSSSQHYTTTSSSSSSSLHTQHHIPRRHSHYGHQISDAVGNQDSSNFDETKDTSASSFSDSSSTIVLQPSLNALAAQLTSLMSSNHTLSPYTRTLHHMTFRSTPVTTPAVTPRHHHHHHPSSSSHASPHSSTSSLASSGTLKENARRTYRHAHMAKLPGISLAEA